jgi:hypothetical protein
VSTLADGNDRSLTFLVNRRHKVASLGKHQWVVELPSGNFLFLTTKVEKGPLLFRLLATGIEFGGHRARVGGGRI